MLDIVINASRMYYDCRVRCINMTRTLCDIKGKLARGYSMIQHEPRELTALANLVCIKTTLEVQMSGSRLRKFMRLCGPRVEGHHLLCGGLLLGAQALSKFITIFRNWTPCILDVETRLHKWCKFCKLSLDMWLRTVKLRHRVIDPSYGGQLRRGCATFTAIFL